MRHGRNGSFSPAFCMCCTLQVMSFFLLFFFYFSTVLEKCNTFSALQWLKRSCILSRTDTRTREARRYESRVHNEIQTLRAGGVECAIISLGNDRGKIFISSFQSIKMKCPPKGLRLTIEGFPSCYFHNTDLALCFDRFDPAFYNILKVLFYRLHLPVAEFKAVDCPRMEMDGKSLAFDFQHDT